MAVQEGGAGVWRGRPGRQCMRAAWLSKKACLSRKVALEGGVFVREGSAGEQRGRPWRRCWRMTDVDVRNRFIVAILECGTGGLHGGPGR